MFKNIHVLCTIIILKQISSENNELKIGAYFGNQLFENNEYDEVTPKFRKGAICYSPLIGNPAQAVYAVEDNKYKNSELIGVDSSFLGYPVSDKITDNHGISISYFEFGVMVSGLGIPEPIICRYTFPKVGNPAIVSPARGYEIKNFIRGTFENIKTSVYDHIVQRRPQFFEELFSNSFFLRAVSSKSRADDVPLFPEVKVEPVTSPVTKEGEVTVSVSLGPSPSVSLHDKTLFDVGFRFVNEFVLAPHAIFANKSWDNFVIMHVTDIHVSRRLEYAKDDLKKQPDFINEFNIKYFNNFNDNFRDFISYVNTLHKSSAVDCILATGDLVDYIFDSGEQTARTPRNPSDVDRVNGNNFDFFKRLILGLEPGRDGTKNEELLVPIFTSLGNHDYRDLPYCWTGDVDITGFRNPRLDNFANTNLLFSEAKGLEGGESPHFSKDNAAKMAHVDTNIPQYDKINSKRSYIINLGPHRIVMLDSSHDIGIIASDWDAFVHYMGWDSQDSKRFAGGSPNSAGVQQEHIQLLKQALEEAGSTGIVIVGIHAPLMDMSYYPHYLRETDRANPDENVMKRGFPYFAPFFSTVDGYKGNGELPGWPMTGTPFFKFGGVDFTLANGVSKGANQEFLEICAGNGVSRKVDLVLSGHGHYNFEFRVGFEPDRKLLFFHDYYTENPVRYYATKLLSESDFNDFKRQFAATFNPSMRELIFQSFRDKMKYHFTVPKDGLIQPRFAQTAIPTVPEGDGDPIIAECIEVPTNANPLNKTNDKISWWTKHRPLFIETEALGPISTKNFGARNPDARLSSYGFFHGCRKITIRNNVISSIEVVHMSEIRGPKSRLCSLRELSRVRGISFPASIRALAEDIKRIPPISERLKKE
jgi:hypothetical protein